MAHYDPHKNRGFDGYGQPVYGGRQVVTYHATVESYVASNEELVSLGGGYPTTHNQIRRPLGSTHVQPDDYSPKFSHTNGSPPKFNGSSHNSPRKAFQSAHSPPPAHYSGMYGTKLTSPHDSPRKDFSGGFGRADDDSSDDDVECRDGVCYPKPKHGGYAGGNYHQPRKDSPPNHHQTSGLHKYNNTTHDQKLPEGNNMYGSNPYTHTKPVTDPYYDKNNYTHPKNDHYNGKSSNGKLPAPIKTRATDHYRDGKNSPVSEATQRRPFAASPRKDRKEVIDSSEAQRRHGNAPQQSGDQKYRPTIDSETAAKMYGGVFVK